MDFDELFKQIISDANNGANKDALRVLNDFIEQLTKVERTYNNLQDIFALLLEALPHAIWVFESSGITRNSRAKNIDKILEICPSDFSECEVLFEGEYFLMQKIAKNSQILVTATNITNEKQKERLASMGQISAHLAHEIRNPIGAIAIMISSLLNQPLEAKTKIYIIEMKRAIWRVERLINATLMLSKNIEPLKETHKSSVICEIIRDSVHYFEYGKKIDFRYKLDSPEITCDRELLELLLQNLIFNAIEAIEESAQDLGVIDIEFTQNGAIQELKIYDNGNLASDERSLFEPFKSTKTKGNGLGLALCKRIAEAHNGDIFYNASPKHFCVTLANI